MYISMDICEHSVNRRQLLKEMLGTKLAPRHKVGT
jgi:hypothetical protein